MEVRARPLVCTSLCVPPLPPTLYAPQCTPLYTLRGLRCHLGNSDAHTHFPLQMATHSVAEVQLIAQPGAHRTIHYMMAMAHTVVLIVVLSTTSTRWLVVGKDITTVLVL